MSSKIIISQSKLQKILHKTPKKTLIFASGVFDLLHIGHLKYLKKAKSLGDLLVVWLDSDAKVKKCKGPSRPLNPLKQRMQIIASLKSVDYVLPFREKSPQGIIKKFKPDFIVRSKKCCKNNPIHKIVEKYGGKMYYVNNLPSLSTTKIIQKIRKNNLK